MDMLTWRSRCPDVMHSTDNPRFGLLYLFNLPSASISVADHDTRPIVSSLEVSALA